VNQIAKILLADGWLSVVPGSFKISSRQPQRISPIEIDDRLRSFEARLVDDSGGGGFIAGPLTSVLAIQFASGR